MKSRPWFSLLPDAIRDVDFNTVNVLKKLNQASRALGNLNGSLASVPNSAVLITTLTLQEAQLSSEIENIVTTQDELFEANIDLGPTSPEVKEVNGYAAALTAGFERARRDKIIRRNDLLEIQRSIVGNSQGLRTTPGTRIQNVTTNEIVHTPPQNIDDIKKLLDNFLSFFNDVERLDYDPLIQLAILHYQFEAIHPFYDGNGRTGRILNVLYLTNNELLDAPVLYLSRYIIENKSEYYRLMKELGDNREWENWVLFILEAIETTAKQTQRTVTRLRELMRKKKEEIRATLPKLYSQDLINHLFKNPYTKVKIYAKDLGKTEAVARQHLNTLEENGFLTANKKGTTKYYINQELLELLAERD